VFRCEGGHTLDDLAGGGSGGKCLITATLTQDSQFEGEVLGALGGLWI
jgi:hypothetical protein